MIIRKTNRTISKYLGYNPLDFILDQATKKETDSVRNQFTYKQGELFTQLTGGDKIVEGTSRKQASKLISDLIEKRKAAK